MNEFQYDSTPQEQAMADLLKSQSHRLARQQIIFALIFLLIIVLAAYYIVTRMIWAIYDGYVRLDENHICAIDDIYVLKVNKEVGETVQAAPSDTATLLRLHPSYQTCLRRLLPFG